MANSPGRVTAPDLCSCEKPNAKKVPTYIKQNESDPVTLDLNSVGIAEDSFPVERYTPLSMLGNGSRAFVVLARDRQRGTKVAVKCFKKMSPEAQRLFDQEVRKNKQLTHTNIAKIVDHGILNGKTPYLVTEYKDGFNLEQYIAVHGRPSYDIVWKVLLAVGEALLYAQKQSVLHRDIKAANIIFIDDMNSEPSILLHDFALPKVKETDELTDPRDAFYLASDETRNMEYTEKAEVYSLGCVGYALLTGRPPFPDGTAREIKNSHSLKLPPRISNIAFDAQRPKDLEEVIERCLEKDPLVRFESIAKLMERLEVFPRREQMQIAAVLADRRKQKLIRISIIATIIVVACVVAFLALSPH
jgi:serine/threonine-protein kinase